MNITEIKKNMQSFIMQQELIVRFLFQEMLLDDLVTSVEQSPVLG